jgi:hypothetical protein
VPGALEKLPLLVLAHLLSALLDHVAHDVPRIGARPDSDSPAGSQWRRQIRRARSDQRGRSEPRFRTQEREDQESDSISGA